MKRVLLHFLLAAAACALTLASCQRPIDIDREGISNRQAINIMAEGEKYEKEGNYPMAIERYNAALELSPRPALYYHLGACYKARGEYSKAQEYLTTAVRMAGDYPAAEYLLSQVRIQLALQGKQGRITTTGARPTPAATASALTPTPRVTPREVASATPTPSVTPRVPVSTPERTPVTPVRTPVVVERTPEPTRTPARITEVEPTPTPRRTPETTVAEGPSYPPSHPIVPTPPPTVEMTRPPRETPKPGIKETPRAVTGAPPAVPWEKVFEPVKAQDTGSTSPKGRLPSVSDSGSTATGYLSQWQFHYEQAQSFIDRHMDDEAVAELLLVLGAQPRHMEARLMLADAYDRLGRGEKALYQYEQARVFAPNHPKPYFRTGNYYLRHADENPTYYDRARTYFYEAIHHDAKYYFAYHNIGITYMKQGDYDAARKYFENALNVKPDYGSAMRNLGLLYEQHLKDPKRAIKYYRDYVKLGGPDTDEVREWLKALEEAP